MRCSTADIHVGVPEGEGMFRLMHSYFFAVFIASGVYQMGDE